MKNTKNETVLTVAELKKMGDMIAENDDEFEIANTRKQFNKGL